MKKFPRSGGGREGISPCSELTSSFQERLPYLPAYRRGVPLSHLWPKGGSVSCQLAAFQLQVALQTRLLGEPARQSRA